MKRFFAMALAAVLLVGSLASCANHEADTDAIEDYAPRINYMIDQDGNKFTFEEGDGETAILVKYEGKATRDDHVTIPAVFEVKDASGVVTTSRTVTTIGDAAFHNLAAVVSVDIPDSVTHIGDYAFASCTELTAIKLPAGTVEIGKLAFSYCDKLATIEMGDELVSIQDFAFWGCTALTDVALPATLESIGNGAFYGCTAMKNVTIPASVTSIGDMAYGECTGLEKIKLHDGIEDLGKFIFARTDEVGVKALIDTTNLSQDSKVWEYVQNIDVVATETEADESTPAETDPAESTPVA